MAAKSAEEVVIDVWNEEYPPGTSVIVVKDDGTRVHTKIRSYAEMLSGHTPVIWLEGISGAYRLDRVIVRRIE